MLLKLVITLHIVFTTTATVFSPTEEQTVERVLNDVLACSRIPSMSVGIVKNNEIWTRGFGEADRERHVNVDAATTRFGIGSLTKAFTTTLLAMLLEESQGRHTWESKVADILGRDFRFVDDERTKETTLKDIVTHRTGLNNAELSLFTGSFTNMTRSEFVRYIRFLPESHDFRDKYDYNNWMYGLAGHVVEVLSGESWETTLERKILHPLGMMSTKVLGYNLNTTSENVAQPYTLVNNEIEKADSKIFRLFPIEPAGAIASTADDMVKWIQFLLNGGKTADGRSLLSGTSLVELFEPHQVLSGDVIVESLYKPIFPVSAIQFGYGYGWNVGNYQGFRSVWHSGIISSYTSTLTLFPDLKFGVYVSQTGMHLNKPISLYLADILLGHEPWLNASTICSFPAPWTPKGAGLDNSDDVTNQEVTDPDIYVGTYGHRFVGEATVEESSAGGSLVLTLGMLTGTLNTTQNERVFMLDVTGIFVHVSHSGNNTLLFPVIFNNTQNGEFTEIKVQYPNPFTLRRGVHFFAPFPSDQTTPPPINGGKRLVVGNYMFAVLMIIAFLIR